MRIEAITALKDNYIWVLRHGRHAIVIDPGAAQPVLTYLEREDLALTGIWLTHHHPDHSGGVLDLLKQYPVPVYASEKSPLSCITHRVKDQDTIKLAPFPAFHVLAIPGHTLDHVAFYHHPQLFCGDTLFTGGCGRAFEGTPEQLYQSLCRLVALGDNTLVYCGHEYTVNNLQFALAVEPNNAELQARMQETLALRAKGQPTVPATIAVERQTNPFLRCDAPDVINTLHLREKVALSTSAQRFAFLRHWKNQFRNPNCLT